MGIDVERFVDVNPELICSICQEVFDNPMETPCRHVFCASCIFNWVNRSITRENNCPTCRNKVGHHSIREALPIIRNILAKQKMRCEFFKLGCSEVVLMDKMKLHLEVCPFQPISCCHDDCDAMVMRQSIAKHERSCVKRKIVCPVGCGGMVVFEETHNPGCVNILKRQLDENLIKFDEKISFIKEKYSSLEARLDQLKQGLKNTNSDKLAQLAKHMLNRQGQASWRNIETDVEKLEKEVEDFTETMYIHLHKKLCDKFKQAPKKKGKRQPKRCQNGRKSTNMTKKNHRSSATCTSN